MIQETRIVHLNRRYASRGDYVLYWMQASQRAECNHALEKAVTEANGLRLPLVVFFGITEEFPGANERHYFFMLQGLQEVKRDLEKRGIQMVIRRVSPDAGAIEMSKRAALLVTDRGYLRIQRAWRDHVAQSIKCPMLQVESDVVIPVEEVSGKEEYAARTIRPKIKRLLHDYLVPLKNNSILLDSLVMEFESFDISNVENAISRLNIDRSVKRVAGYDGGTIIANQRLELFLSEKLQHYNELRNDPSQDATSVLSAYLHFGQISPLYIALRVLERGGQGADALLEELIVRRELSMNYAFYNQDYDSLAGIPEWALRTLKKHVKDKREYTYSLEEVENAATHDPYWNAAQNEMMLTGRMHGYMRMYWGKKIIEWSRNPEEAFRTAVHLNDKYEMDGRDPNGFTGVAWCFGKHDRPWRERPIFGTVRYMSAEGLRRKFDIDAYVKKVERKKAESKKTS